MAIVTVKLKLDLISDTPRGGVSFPRNTPRRAFATLVLPTALHTPASAKIELVISSPQAFGGYAWSVATRVMDPNAIYYPPGLMPDAVQTVSVPQAESTLRRLVFTGGDLANVAPGHLLRVEIIRGEMDGLQADAELVAAFLDVDVDAGLLAAEAGALYAALGHDHATLYSVLAHTHGALYSALGHDHAALYSVLAHAHAALYSALGHVHTGVLAIARYSGDLTIATSTVTVLSWDTNEISTNGIHSTSVNPERFTAPFAGPYLLVCNNRYQTITVSAGVCRSMYQVNGTGLANMAVTPITAGNNTLVTCGVAYKVLAVGDYVEFCAQQTSGSSITHASTPGDNCAAMIYLGL